MLLKHVVDTSNAISRVRGRLEKARRLAALLERLGPDEIPIAVAFLAGEPRQGRIGVGPSTLEAAFPGSASSAPELSLTGVDEALEHMAGLSGPGSTAERTRALRRLLARATREEQDFLARLLLGELRQGALEGLMVEALARAAGVGPDEIRRALMLSGDLVRTATAALDGGAERLSRFELRLFRPLQPMLAQTADDVAEAIARLGTAALEYKLDGARIQAHRRGDDVRVYTRRLNDVTGAVPEIVEAVRELPVDSVVLDGEAIALSPDGTPLPFQATMSRFGRRLDVRRMREERPLSCFFFDCLYLDGEPRVDEPARIRFDALCRAVPEPLRVPRRVTSDPQAAAEFLEAALDAGHEGLMAKDPESAYEAGRRGRAWLKVKPAHTLDLVVLAAEWGHGRRRGWLSNLHLGARDPEGGGFVMLGKTFKGMTDEMLEDQTRRFLELETSRDGHTVYLRPEQVVEIAFNGIQASPHYPGGLALRFARVKRYRPDKGPDEADTIDTVRALYERGTAAGR